MVLAFIMDYYGLYLIFVAIAGIYFVGLGILHMRARIKGLVEAILFSYHGISVILMSTLQGLFLDVIIYIFGKRDLALYLGCGIASASNVAFLQFFLLRPFPAAIFGFMYILAFFSGIVFGGYGGVLLYKMVIIRMERANS